VSDSTEARLRRLEDRQELTDLVTRYSMCVDDRDIDGIVGLFTEDASMGHADGATQGSGPDGIRDYYESKLIHFGHCYHYAHNQLVEFDTDDTAHGVVNAHAEMVIDGEFLVAALRYVDLYERVEGAWRFKQRRSSFWYVMRPDEMAEGMAGPNRKRWPAPPSPGELPESVPAYQAFIARVGVSR
jgi:ketosteroid isomerase-like protein